jgi:N-methylhydantoinase A
MAYRLGIDSGGTFTDVVLFDDKKKALHITKTPSTPANPAIGVINGIKKIVSQVGIEPHEIASLVHGTTVATNALLEYKGIRTALILTEGFKDILSIGRQDRPKLYDYFERRPEPFIPRHLRFEVSERTLYDGKILRPLDEEEVRGIAGKLKEIGIKGVAVCLLHSYANPAHEKRIKEIFKTQYPDAVVSTSHEILPEFREYERMSTTVINAYVMPIIDRYLQDLQRMMREEGLTADLNVMQSNGGVMTSLSAGEKSVHTILSGPAGGVMGSLAIGTQIGMKNLITVDMGGTSFDICLIRGGKIHFTKESEIGGHPIKIPMIDIHTIGAGGGSIAWIDPGGALRVGPQSAGANPGPVCYRLGGEEPTVTDANLVLGRLDPGYYLGGEMSLDAEAAKQAILNKIARPLKLSLEEAAEGIIKVINASMVRGIRKVSVEKGFDAREFSMICFGGGGPLHSLELAEELRIPTVVVPISPGVNSALGLLIADFRYDYSQTFLRKTQEIDLDSLNQSFKDLEIIATQQMLDEKIPREEMRILRSVEMRYSGQGYELEVSVSNGMLTEKDLKRINDSFHQLHRQLYGYASPQEVTEFVYLRIAALGKIPKPKFKKEKEGNRKPARGLKGKRKIFVQGKYVSLPIYERTLLRPGDKIQGPAVIEQMDSTTFLSNGRQAQVDPYLNLVVTIGKRS